MTSPVGELRRVLCLRLRSMGDAVLMTPALAALRRALPDAAIHVLIDRELATLFDAHPDVDRLHALGRTGRDKLSMALRLRKVRFDAVVNFHGGPTSALLTAATGAPVRVGRAIYRYGLLYNRKVPSPEQVFNDPRAGHTVHSQASLVTALGIEVPDLSLHLTVSKAARQRVARRLEGLGVFRQGYVVVQPTASFPSKQWSPGRFVELAQRLASRTGRDVLWSLPEPSRGGPHGPSVWRSMDQSLPAIDSLKERLGRDFPVLRGLPLTELVALMEGAGLYVGNDSGPMHLAAAFGRPVVAVFGSSSPTHWRPWGSPHRILWAGLDCSPCHGKFCVNPERFACLESIRTGDVLDAALDLLGAEGPSTAFY